MRKIITYRFLGFCVTLLFILKPNFSLAQWTLDVIGSVKKEETKKRMEGAIITIKRNGSVFKTIKSDATGKFQLNLPSNAIYLVEFSKPGYVSKRIEFSTKNYPPEEAKLGFDFPMEMNLFEKIEGLDVSILNKPIAKIAYNPDTGYPDHDPSYTKSIQKELDRLKKELAERLKQQEVEQKIKQKSYDEAIALADKSFNIENWSAAQPHYEKAASIFPKETYPTEQLEEIKAQLEKNATTEKAYSDAIANADAAFSNKEYADAKSNYAEALNIKENEQYPADKIKEIESIITNAEKLEEEYNETIALADQFFDEKEYLKAKENYNKGLGLKPDEKYPLDKIKEIDGIIADLAQKDKGYNEAIAKADSRLGAKEYQNAIDFYKTALNFKPEESYPKEKIEEAIILLANMKELQENYEKLIIDADAAFSNKEYDEAKSNYEEALNLFEGRKYPKDRIEEIAIILNAKAKQEEGYQTAIAQGDAAFGTEEYESAKASFEKALSLKPEEDYPKDKLEEIKTLLEELAAKNAEDKAAALALKALNDEYNGFMASGSSAVSIKDYEDAIKNYESAIEIKPEEQLPKDKIDEINELLAELERKKEEDESAALAQKELDDEYSNFINAADIFYNNRAYDDAIENYQEALEVKPIEQYPTDKIKEIENLLATIELKKEEDELAAESERKKGEYYEALIAEADGEFDSENYAEAETKYTEAIGVMPTEKYPKEKIQEIKDILSKIQADKDNANLAQKEIDDKYKKLIIEADNAFRITDYAKARTKYKNALNVKSEEEYPQNQLDEIEELLAELAKKESEIILTNNALKQKQEEYNAYIKIADQEFDSKRFLKAISNYEQALGLMPDKAYPKEKIDQINQLVASLAEKNKNEKDAALAEKEKRKSYEKLIYEGDRAFKTKTYKSAQSKFNAALTLYPDEKYPSDKLTELLRLLNTKQDNQNIEVAKKLGVRAKINKDKEREIEERMAALQGKVNIEKDEKLQKKKHGYFQEEEIRIKTGISRTNDANEQKNQYTDGIIEQTKRGNKYHIDNNKTILGATKKLNAEQQKRIKIADKKTRLADQELEVYVSQEIEFMKDQEEMSKDKIGVHKVYVDDVIEAQLVMIERGEKIRSNNRKDLAKIVIQNEKNKTRNKKKRKENEIDVHKYKAGLVKQEEIRITASIDRTTKNGKVIQKQADEMTKKQLKKSNSYKLNVKGLNKLKEGVNKSENKRIKKAEKDRAKNKKINNKIITELAKSTKKQDKKYYKDIKQIEKFKKSILKQELNLKKLANKRTVKSNKEIVKSKSNMGVSGKSQDRRYEEFQAQLEGQRKGNNDFISDLQTIEQEKILLANSGLTNFYVGEKRLSVNNELAKKYPQGITEETNESGNAITIIRTKVTGDHVDVYERVFYAWGGSYFYKNGVNITQTLWDKESID